MKSAQRRRSIARWTGSAVGLFPACSHHRGACTGSTPASSCLEPKGWGSVPSLGFLRGESRGLWENEPSASGLLLKMQQCFKRHCWSSQQDEVIELALGELHETSALHHVIVHFITDNKIHLALLSILSRSRLNSLIVHPQIATFPSWMTPDDRGKKKQGQGLFCVWSGKPSVTLTTPYMLSIQVGTKSWDEQCF